MNQHFFKLITWVNYFAWEILVSSAFKWEAVSSKVLYYILSSL